MGIASRVSNLLVIGLLSLALSPAAFGQMRGVGVGVGERSVHPRGYGADTQQRKTAVDQERSLHEGATIEDDRAEGAGRADRVERRSDGEIDPAREIKAVRGPNVEQRVRRQQRACRYEGRRGRSVDCDYYYDDEGRYYDDDGQVMPGWSPGEPMPPESATRRSDTPGAAKIAPAADPASEKYTESFGPQGSNALRDAFFAGRENWLQKKNELEDARAAVARSEYQSQQTGRPVDPRLIARQEEAEKAADEAHAALAPIVQQAKEAGVSPDLIDLYERENRLD